jgi:hypothetical protein
MFKNRVVWLIALASGLFLSGSGYAAVDDCPLLNLTLTCGNVDSGSAGVDVVNSSSVITAACPDLSCTSNGIATEQCAPNGGNALQGGVGGTSGNFGFECVGIQIPIPGSISCSGVTLTFACVFAGTPGSPNCHGTSVSALANQYGGLDAAATALGYSNVQALQDAVTTYCGS